MKNRYYVYRTTAMVNYHYGKSGRINMMLLTDAGDYFTSRKDAEEHIRSVAPELKPIEEIVSVEVKQFERERNGTYRYTENFKVYETLRNADDTQDYYYIEVSVRITAINEQYGIYDKVPVSECRRAKGAMERFVSKRERYSGLKWRYSVMEIPEEQIDFDLEDTSVMR